MRRYIFLRAPENRVINKNNHILHSQIRFKQFINKTLVIHRAFSPIRVYVNRIHVSIEYRGRYLKTSNRIIRTATKRTPK